MLEAIKEELWKLHLMLPAEGLVTWTSGNVSARDPESGLVVIKPSGVMYEQLRPEDHVVLDLEGDVIEGKLKPSSDTASHLYIYRQRPEVNGIVHTHSPFATILAIARRPIPAVHYMMAAFGGPEIRCSDYACYGTAELSAAVLRAERARGGTLPRPLPRFAHGAVSPVGAFTLIASYHPSRQNTQTGRLTAVMLHSVFRRARAEVAVLSAR